MCILHAGAYRIIAYYRSPLFNIKLTAAAARRETSKISRRCALVHATLGHERERLAGAVLAPPVSSDILLSHARD